MSTIQTGPQWPHVAVGATGYMSLADELGPIPALGYPVERPRLGRPASQPQRSTIDGPEI